MRTPDGRTLEVVEAGAPDGPVVVAHHGTPGSGRFYRTEVESAQERGLRLITYSRPGYAGSSPHRDRDAASAAADVAAILDGLGVERFATYGTSGGGPHALACAALLGDRCAAAATIAGVGPADASDLDFLAGMGEGNVAEFGAAREGREALDRVLPRRRGGHRRGHAGATGRRVPPPPQRRRRGGADRRARRAPARRRSSTALRPGVEGWVDDDFAFLAPWGFDVGAIEVPVLVWQGEHDLMVPPAARRLAARARRRRGGRAPCPAKAT